MLTIIYEKGFISDHSVLSKKLTEFSQFLFAKEKEDLSRKFQKWIFELKIVIALPNLKIFRSGFM